MRSVLRPDRRHLREGVRAGDEPLDSGPAVERLANRLEPAYERIGEKVRGSPMLSPDETGWKIGGQKAWLHVTATREESYFVIARGRGREEAADLIGAHYTGTIVRDGWIGYRGRDAFPKARSQTCLAHILRRIEGLFELSPEGPALLWLTTLKKLLKRAIRIRDRRDDAEIGAHGLMLPSARSSQHWTGCSTHVPRIQAAAAWAAHLSRERKAMFTFLHQDAVPATNFLAEQAIRPAVVNRKMSGGNNTARKAWLHAAATGEASFYLIAILRGTIQETEVPEPARDPPV